MREQLAKVRGGACRPRHMVLWLEVVHVVAWLVNPFGCLRQTKGTVFFKSIVAGKTNSCHFFAQSRWAEGGGKKLC